MAALIVPSFVQELRSGTVRHASEHIQRQCDNWQLAGAIVWNSWGQQRDWYLWLDLSFMSACKSSCYRIEIQETALNMDSPGFGIAVTRWLHVWIIGGALMFHCPKLERMMMTLAPRSHLDWKSCVPNGPDDSSLRVLTCFAGAAIYLGWAHGGPSLSQLGM